MPSPILDILAELYELAPELEKHQDAIVRIIEKMRQNQPHIEINEGFRAELKEKIMLEFAYHREEMGRNLDASILDAQIHPEGQKSSNKSFQASRNDSNNWFSRSWFLGFGSAFGVGLAGFLIAIPILGLFQASTPETPPALGGSYSANPQSANMSTRMMMTQTVMNEASGTESPPYLEYVYTGSLAFLPREPKSYQQLYPTDDARIDGTLVIESYGETLDQKYFDANRLQQLSSKKLTDSEIRDLIKKGGDASNLPQKGQKKVQISIDNPIFVYVRTNTFTDEGISTGQNYIPSILFQVLYDGQQREIVVPIVNLAK